MTWNWQHPDWPNFTWDRDRLVRAEAEFWLRGGAYIGSVRHIAAADKDQLAVLAMSVEAVGTAAIEGEHLDYAGVQSSIRRHLGMTSDRRRVGAAENGIAEMMVDLRRSFAEPLSHDRLFVWHRMLAAGRQDLDEIGGYRRHGDPMQVVSGPVHAPRVHFEAPAAIEVPREMGRFLDWFNRTGPDGATPLPALTRAGLAHLAFVCIHPFEDGNGRIGRAIAEKALAQSLRQPTHAALAVTILARRKSYYDALARNNTALDVTDWLVWFAATVIEAQRRSLALVDFLIAKAELLERLGDRLNERQNKVLQRMLQEGPEGFAGGLSASNYVTITKAATATASRDLADMVAKGALVRSGERRHARYQVNIPLQPVTLVTIDGQGRVSEAETAPSR